MTFNKAEKLVSEIKELKSYMSLAEEVIDALVKPSDLDQKTYVSTGMRQYAVPAEYLIEAMTQFKFDLEERLEIKMSHFDKEGR